MADVRGALKLAREAAERAGVVVEPLRGLAGAEQALQIIAAVWGEQPIPRELLRALEHAGAILYGARSGDEVVGFVLGFAGISGGLHLHSHMLAVLDPWRSRGVGYALKLAQRAFCLEHGIEDVRWTFDPLVARNGRFNLARLGAVASDWLPDFYGDMRDALNAGDRSDRLEVRWALSSERVAKALVGTLEAPSIEDAPRLLVRSDDSEMPSPIERKEEPAGAAIVEVPRDHLTLRRRDPELGRRWREASARALSTCYARGLVAAWMTERREYVLLPREAIA